METRRLEDAKPKKDWSVVVKSVVLMALIGGPLTWLGLSYYSAHHSGVAKASCDNPQIKGNISYSTGEKIYHVPGDRFYDRTQIDTAAGERMFCTEEEAQQAGWRKSAQ
ncbi:sunset domain-containing protein [Streptomyces sp. NPDC002078]